MSNFGRAHGFDSSAQLPDLDPDLLPAIREFFSRWPEKAHLEAFKIAVYLWMDGYLSYKPREAAVQAALDILDVERGQVA